jgi:hypothetical protein
MFAGILFAKMSSVAKNESRSIFWLILSICSISYLFCFRNQTGIDDMTYLKYFYRASNISLVEYMGLSNLEMGYKTINYLIYYITDGNYNTCQFFFAFTPICLIMLALWKKREYIDLALAVLYFYMILYYYIMNAGLVRIFFAVGVVFYSLDYLMQNEIRKYIVCVVIASLFHVSALFMLSLLIVCIRKNYYIYNLKYLSVILIIMIPVAFYFVSKYAPSVLGEDRYGSYAEMESNRSIFDMADRLPFIFIALYFLRYITNAEKEYRLYIVLMILTIAINISSIWMTLGRCVYYTNTGIMLCMSFLMKHESIRRDNIVVSVLVAIPFIYMMHSIFNNSYFWEHLNNYSTFF